MVPCFCKVPKEQKHMARTKNIFVIDTCVLLHDPECIFKFQEHDIYIPLACIDDLDEIKTRRDSVGWAAREVFRNMEKHDIQKMTSGIVINESGGKIFIYNNEEPPLRGEKPNISRVNSDNAIINSARELEVKYPKRKVIIVTKDVALRVRAISFGCRAENYKTDLLGEKELFHGYRYVNIEDMDDWNYLSKRKDCDIKLLNCKDQLNELSPNEFIAFRFGNQSVLGWFRQNQIVFLDDKKKESYMGIVAKNMEQRFALEALANDDIPLVCLSGPAGSGKTLAALAVALEKVEQGEYDRIIVMKPMIAVGGKDVGFLPGSKMEKVSAWLGPIKDNILQLTSAKGAERFGGNSFEEMIEDGKIEVEAMAFIQGRSIPNSFIILDEAENVSPKEARMVVERCGKDSKVVLLGDLSQIENTYLDKYSCGLAHAINGGKNHDVAASINLTKVERSILAATASKIFKVK